MMFPSFQQLNKTKQVCACVLSHLYSSLCVVITWSVVFLSSWPLKLQEMCGFG